MSTPLPIYSGIKRQSGFALVIALSLMAFVLLLLLSITSFVAVEQQGSNIAKQQLSARQNALAGLQVAMGELQLLVGPDQRVTASADILEETNNPYTLVWHSDSSKGWDNSTRDWSDSGSIADFALPLVSVNPTKLGNLIKNTGEFDEALLDNTDSPAIELMKVKHAVITSVNRDELADRGASVWHETVRAIKERTPAVTIETLIPDVRSSWDALETMISPGQEVVSHNMETVERLYRMVRPQAKYARSLEQIRRTKDYGKRTKSGIMVGLGETADEVAATMDDLLEHGCDVLTIGQYLQPTRMHLDVAEFVHPDVFANYREIGISKGFPFVESGPLVRSSYHAERHL